MLLNKGKKCLFLVLKAALQSCHFLNVADCSNCSYTCLYPLSHYIDFTDVFF